MNGRIIYGAEISENLLRDIERKSLGEYLTDACEEYASKISMINAETGECATYRDTLDKSHRVASLLLVSGCTSQAVVGVVSEHSFNFPSILLATLNIGAIFTGIDPKNTTNEILHLLNTSKPLILFTTSDLYERIKDIQQKCDFIKDVIDIDNVVYPENVNNNLRYNGRRKIKPTDTAVIMYSSGSTGLPKGVMQSHKSLIYSLELYKSKKIISYHRGNVTCAQSPMYYPYGLRISLMAMVLGQKYVLVKNRTNERVLLTYIQRYQINNMFINPAFAVFLSKDATVEKYDVSSVQILSCASDLLRDDIRERVKLRLGCSFFDQYAMSETGLTIFGGLVASAKRGVNGHLIPGFMAKIVDPETGKILGPLRQGELCLKGPTMFKGYLGDAANEDVFCSGGWFRTGDLAFYDDDEDFVLLGRLKQVIKYKTTPICPPEIEMLILQLADVVAVGVIGVPDEIYGELPRAYVVRKPNSEVTAEDIMQYVASNISPAKQLHGGVKFVDDLPRTGTGKVNRRKIKQQFIEGEM